MIQSLKFAFLYLSSFGFIFILGCSDGSFSTQKKNKAKSEKSESSGDNNGLADLDEDENADSPTEIAGAFLVGCGYTAEAKSSSASACGCAVVDKNTKQKTAPNATFSFVKMTLKSGKKVGSKVADATKSTNWHGFFNCPSVDTVEKFTGFTTIAGKKHDFTAFDARHNPENLIYKKASDSSGPFISPDPSNNDFVNLGPLTPTGSESCNLTIGGTCYKIGVGGRSCSYVCNELNLGVAPKTANQYQSECNDFSKALGMPEPSHSEDECEWGCYQTSNSKNFLMCSENNPDGNSDLAKRLCACKL